MEFEKRCWAEIDLDKIEHNFRVIKRRAPHSMIMAVVKADAYGHGDAVIASTPVSYTHLDVYKRQTCSRSRMGRPAGR